MPAHRRHRVLAPLLVGLAALAGCTRPAGPAPAATSAAGPAADGGPARVLVFTRTLGFRHASIPAAVAAVARLAPRNGLLVEHTEDPARFTAAGLRPFRAVVFLSTTGDVLDAAGERALRGFVEAGGGFLGVHAAADTEYGWPWYEALVGARFARHPPVQRASVRVADRDHPATAGLPERWVRTDEWYDFRANPRGRVRVLATLDESTYQGGGMGADHPIAWCQGGGGSGGRTPGPPVDGGSGGRTPSPPVDRAPLGRGRAFYTAGGHTEQSWSEPRFLQHVAGALRWAAGVAPGSCRPG